MGEMIEAVVVNGESFGLEVSYSPDGSTLLGTGGELKNALPFLGEHFFVLYGDSLLPVDFSAVQLAYTQSGQYPLMTVLKNGDRWDKSNVLFQQGKLVEYNKRAPKPDMVYADYGQCVVSTNVLAPYPLDEPFDLVDLYQELSSKGQLSGLEVHERFYEIGSHEGLNEVEDYFFTMEKA